MTDRYSYRSKTIGELSVENADLRRQLEQAREQARVATQEYRSIETAWDKYVCDVEAHLEDQRDRWRFAAYRLKAAFGPYRAQLEQVRKDYYKLADAVAPSSLSVEDLCRQAWETRQAYYSTREQLKEAHKKIASLEERLDERV